MTDINVLNELGKEYTYHVGLTSNVSSPDPIKFKSPFENVIAVEVMQSEIPYCDYTIDTFRKTFNINGTDVELTLGDYNADKL